jgi:hypothetical protein
VLSAPRTATQLTDDRAVAPSERAVSPVAADAARSDAASLAGRTRAASSDVRQDLAMLAVAARARCADQRAEDERRALLGDVHAAGLDLARQLRDHTLHSMAEYRGSHSAWDVLAESEALAVAHDRYVAVARRAAVRLRAVLADAQAPR